MSKGNDWKTAVNDAKQVVSRRPEFAVSYVMLGQAYFGSGLEALQSGQAETADEQFRNSVKEFQNALDRQSTNREALLGLVNAYASLKQPDKLGEAIAKARSLYPDSGQFRELALNYDLTYSAHPEEVVAERQKLLDTDPNQVDNYLALARAQLRLSQFRGAADAAVKAKYASDAQDVLTKAVAKFPGNIQAISLLAQVLQYSGNAAGGEKLLVDLAAQADWKNKPLPDQLLADYYLRGGAKAPAEQALRRAYDKSGRSVELQLSLAQLMLQESRFDDALKLLDDNTSNPKVERQRIQTLIAARKFDDAESATKRLLASSPGATDLLNLLTSIYLDAGRFADARAATRNALAADRNSDLALYQQALAEASLPDGDLDLAVRDLGFVKDRNPGFTRGRMLLAQVLQRKGQADEAIRELENALQATRLSRDARWRCSTRMPVLIRRDGGTTTS